jgi:hypothetical protein
MQGISSKQYGKIYYFAGRLLPQQLIFSYEQQKRITLAEPVFPTL